MTEQFWMIYSERGNPSKCHADYHSVSEEATRLALKHPGIKFYLLQAREMFETEPPKVVKKLIL